MAEPRKVPFVTISSFSTSPTSESKKRRREDETEITFGKDGGGGGSAVAAAGSEGGGGLFGNVKGGEGESAETKPTVRLKLCLTEPSERGSAEFNYGELIQSTLAQGKVKPTCSDVPKGLTPALDPNDPFADDDKERREVEALAKKFESKYGNVSKSAISKRKKKDRMQDLIDIGYGYDETDPFIDNSEAYDELVPASLTTKHGGFYINTGTLQFRAASDSEGEEGATESNHFKKAKDGEERVIKKRIKKKDGGTMEVKKPTRIRVQKSGVTALNIHRPEKKKRKKLMKDSLHLANMLRRFNREKEEMRKKNPAAALPRPAAATATATVPRPATTTTAIKVPNANSALLNAHSKAAGSNDYNMGDLTADPTMMTLLGSVNNNDVLQDMMGDLDFSLLDSPQPSSPAQGENGSMALGHKAGVLSPPPLPSGLAVSLTKRIEDLRTASRQFDEEGRKKFFTLDMNNILLDIELQVQEQPVLVRAAVYSHLEAFVPCNKEALLKRLKKLSLNIQDDRLRAPLLRLKLAVCSVMPEQIARYNMDCIAKVAKQQSGEAEKNGSEEEDEEKPGKRVMGPRKKFIWDDKLRVLLCNLVRVKLGCYELEGKTLSPEDYLKAFMETEVKPLWPKGWMQARMLFKESSMAHFHLTGNTAKKKMVPTPKTKTKEGGWVQRPTPSAGATPSQVGQVARRPPQSPSEPICLDSLDGELAPPSLDSISHALAILSNAAKGLAHGDSPPSPEGPKAAPSSLHTSPLLLQHKRSSVSTPHYVSTSSPSLSRPPSITSSPSLSRPPSVTSSPSLSRPPSVTSSPSLSRPPSVTSSPSLSRPPSVTSSPSLSRPASATSSPLTSARSEGLGGAKAQAHRHSALTAQRPGAAGVAKAPGTPSAVPKLRPPPTASPLVAPGSKPGGGAPPSVLHKISNNAKVNSGDALVLASPRSHTLASPAHLTLKAPSLSLSLPGAQSQFITPMQATLTKPAHSSTPPIIKLTPRAPPPHPRATPSIHQYTAKSPAGFRPPFSGAQGGAAKPGQGAYAPPVQKTPSSSSSSSSTNTSLINTSSVSKHSGSSPSPATASANQGQRQRSGVGPTQGTKPITSVSTPSVSSQLPQVSTAGGGGLLGSTPILPLGFGMLGDLVPISLPFQFPQLLNLPPLGSAGSSTGASNNTAFSTLTQNLYKSLQSGSQVALPPHLQLAFSDVNQSQGGDAKRKTL